VRLARKHELPATTLNGGTIGFLMVGRAVTILHVGWMDNHPNLPADGAGEDMLPTALDHLFRPHSRAGHRTQTS
jgi:hypothetical protein